MEVLQMFRRKAEKRMVELSPDEARLLRGAVSYTHLDVYKRQAPVRVEIQQNGLVGTQYLIFEICSSNFQFSHE